MEDAHTHLLAIPDDKDAAFFAVYDGHGGAKVSQYAGTNLHKKIVQNAHYSDGRIEDAIRAGFLQLDDEMIRDEQMKDELSGTTAVIVIIKDEKIYCGNVGDSRAVACVSGLAEPLSFDHKPANEHEARRIVAAGGWVEFNRVNGNLALSRALGDFVFKKNETKPPEEQIVTSNPDITTTALSSDHEFIVLACDGIWDVMSSQEVVDFCRDRLAAGRQPEIVCEELLARCLAPDCQMGGLGCDNMTAVLVCLLQNQGWDTFVDRCNRPRAPTPQHLPTTGTDDSEGDNNANESPAFVTPPRTPIKSTSANEPPASSSQPQTVVESLTGDAVAIVGGDQRVPDLVHIRDDEPPPTQFSTESDIIAD